MSPPAPSSTFLHLPRRMAALAGAVLTLAFTGASAQPPEKFGFEDGVEPFLDRYCSRCHNAERARGGINLEMFATEVDFLRHRQRAEEVIEALEHVAMPPEDARHHPTAEGRGKMAGWIRWTLDNFDPEKFKHPGQLVAHRLTRTQYRHTIRDLVGVGMEVADDLPTDEPSHGFDVIGESQDMSAAHLERFVDAANYVLDSAFPIESRTTRFEAEELPYLRQFGMTGEDEKVDFPKDAPEHEVSGGEHRIYHTGGVTLTHAFPMTGLYEFRVRLWGRRAEGVNRGPELKLKLDAHTVAGIGLPTHGPDQPETAAPRVIVRGGMRDIKLDMEGMAVNLDAADPTKRFNLAALDFIEIIGPLKQPAEKAAGIRQRLIPVEPGEGVTPREAARGSLGQFAARAFRRPVDEGEIGRLMMLYDRATEDGRGFDEAMKLALKAVLVSPHFLMHLENEEEGGEPHRVTPFELASRLSYFLWSSLPDDELRAAAADGSLQDPAVLEAQTRRMLVDPKARSLAEHFAPQWLGLGSLYAVHRDGDLHPNNLGERRFLHEEVVRYFDHVVREDRPIHELVSSDYAIVNEWLAKHYGLPEVQGREFRKVDLDVEHAARRGGVLGMAGVYLSISHPNDTNPSGRGKWVLDTLLGTPPPPPPADVPPLPKGGGDQNLTLRERMAIHSDDPTCASCHRKIDPIGFALENYDQNGRWRDQENGKPLDVSGEMPGGARINGPAELRRFLLTEKREAFERAFSTRLLTYALRRGLDFYDEGALREILSGLRQNDSRFSAAVIAIVQSDPFQYRQDPVAQTSSKSAGGAPEIQ
jgi:hypothetical protein